MRRGDVLEILDGRKSPLSHDSGFDSGLGSQSLSAYRSEGEATMLAKGCCNTQQLISQSVFLFVCLSVCLSICLSVCLSVCLSGVCLSVCLSFCLFVCLSVSQSVRRADRQTGRQAGNRGLNHEFVNYCEIKVNFTFFDLRSVRESPQ